MTNTPNPASPVQWAMDEPCPSCGSSDIAECSINVSVDQVRVGWECRECGHAFTWTTRPEDHASHVVERRLVEVMPLHAITALYGERGLRERFAAEIGKSGDKTGRQQVKQALQLAGHLHAADRRQREPYVNHVLRVALRITCHYGVHNAEVIAAALLHDTVEDHATALSPAGRSGAFATLKAAFGSQVAGLVEAVTNPVYLPGTDANLQYRAHVEKSLTDNPWARVIKVSDFTDNGVGLLYTTGAKAVKSARKYAPLVPVLGELILRPDTPLSFPAKARIIGQLDSAKERFAAIIANAEDN